MREIIFYAPGETLGESTPEECENFRNFAKRQLVEQFPGYKITISTNGSVFSNSWCSDLDTLDEVIEFCSELWTKWDNAGFPKS